MASLTLNLGKEFIMKIKALQKLQSIEEAREEVAVQNNWGFAIVVTFFF
jgi:hypothetical protein